MAAVDFNLLRFKPKDIPERQAKMAAAELTASPTGSKAGFRPLVSFGESYCMISAIVAELCKKKLNGRVKRMVEAAGVGF